MIFAVFFFLFRVTTRISRDCIAQYVVGHLRTVAEARSVSHHSKLAKTCFFSGYISVFWEKIRFGCP